MQDPNTESVARACRAHGRAGIPDPPFPPQRLTREFASVAEGGFLKFWAVLEFRYRYSTGIPYDFELILILILILILNCSTVVLNCHKHLDDLLLRSAACVRGELTSRS